MSSLDRFHTERLSAERLQENHIEFIHQMHQDERIMAYLGGIRSREQTTDYMEQNLSHWQRYGYGIWILREKVSGELIGRGGLRHTVLGGKEEVEAAYGLLPEYWQQGLATEFVRHIVRIGLSEIGLSSVACVTHPDHIASQRVLEKAGFMFERDVVYKGEPHFIFRQDKPEL